MIYALALAIFGFFLNFATPYQIGLALCVDRTGRGAVVFLLMLKAGVVVGPLLASIFVDSGQFTMPLVIASGCFLLSFVNVAVVARWTGDRSASPAA